MATIGPKEAQMRALRERRTAQIETRLNEIAGAAAPVLTRPKRTKRQAKKVRKGNRRGKR